MSRNYSVLRFRFSLPTIRSLLFSALLIAVITGFISCNTGTKGKYKFHSESMHWLQFRGQDASGIAPVNADPPVHFNADTNLLWRMEILPGWSSPCIVNARIFLTGFNSSDSMAYTMAIDRESGKILWRDSVTLQENYFLHPINSYANPTVTSDGKRVFAHFPGYGLIAYNLDGVKSWEFHHQPITHFVGGASSPVVLDSIIIVNVNNMKDTRIQALDCETGDTLWAIRDSVHKWSAPRSSASPLIWDNLIIIHQMLEIVAYNIHDGKPVWWIETPTTGVGTPVVHDDILYANTWSNLGEESVRGMSLDFKDMLMEFDSSGNQMIEESEVPDSVLLFQRPERKGEPRTSIAFHQYYSYMDENGDSSVDEDEWASTMEFLGPFVKDHGMLAIPVSGKGERPFSDILWKVNKDTPETPSPVVVGENIMFIKSGGIITVIDRKTGNIFKNHRIGASGAYISSPMLAGNRIYTCSYNGTVSVLSGEDFSVLAQNKLGERIGASPVAVDDVLYIRTDKHLYAFREQ